MSMAKPLMVQGTMSNAGKSFLAAGLCRVFVQDGYGTAPFKSQNMALNSFVTGDGLEMGRAQVMQAEAANIEPDVRMNPVLLKPTGNSTSQVIVCGEVLRDMRADEYYAFKKELIPRIKDAYSSLAGEHDIIVIEGAGSPAEINLNENDIVNMGMAKMASSPVILVADIDRGGVFAQLYGTWALLGEEERALLKGFVINKFRGDETLLTSGIRDMEERMGLPCLGVLPMEDIDLDDEDSLAERLLKETPAEGMIDIAVIRFPWISNFTDFNVFSMLPGVRVRYVGNASALGKPDMIVLPGSKNTPGDLAWLKESGTDERILKLHAEGAVIFGICGGYQILGERIEEAAADGSLEAMEGLKLLPVKTFFEKEKKRTRAEGTIGTLPGVLSALSGKRVSGYEIHMGSSNSDTETKPFCVITDTVSGKTYTDGCAKDNVYGTYLHGVFDTEETVTALIGAIAKRKGIRWEAPEDFSVKAYRQAQYDKLADLVRNHLDMERVYGILKEGVAL